MCVLVLVYWAASLISLPLPLPLPLSLSLSLSPPPPSLPPSASLIYRNVFHDGKLLPMANQSDMSENFCKMLGYVVKKH
jgi:hypothetical protein